MKKLPIIILSLTLLAASCNIFPSNQPATTSENNIDQTQTENQSSAISYEGEEGVDALTLLKQNYEIETKDFGADLGEFVEAIEGIKPASDQFWKLYVNGESSNLGASAVITHDGDVVEWRLETINQY